MVVPALPVFQDSLGVSAEAASWLLTANLLAGAVATPILGRLGDMFGKDRVLFVVMGLLIIGTVVAALSTTAFLPMIVARVLQGCGAGIFPVAFGIIRDEFPPDRRPHAVGLMSSLFGIGGGAGLVLAGPISDGLGTPWLFWIPLVVMFLVTAAMVWIIPRSPVLQPGRVNFVSAALLAGGLVSLLLLISLVNSWGPLSAGSIGLLVAAVLLLGGWVLSDLRSSAPLVDVRLLSRRALWTTNVAAFMLGLGMYASFLLLPRFVQQPGTGADGYGVSLATAGLYLVPQTVALVALGQLSGVFDRLLGARRSLLVGCSIVTVSFLGLTLARAKPWELLLWSGLSGVGMALAFAAMANLVMSSVPQNRTGQATGVNTVTRTVGGTIGGQAVVALLAVHTPPGGFPDATGYTISFTFCTVAMVGAVFVAWIIPKRPRGRDRDTVVATGSDVATAP
ncbi:MFS transporter [Nakamurella sp. YIM 132084]|uniref:MFS transporter n=2 Tax=Nakamurella leprariae TaxID=2803911 RepID=A0A938YCW0_9ACTN|nr:MFS transporter [Nakamurella leprariae]